MIKTFRLRLTLWYLACFALLFFALTAALYGVLSRALIGRLDETLISQAATADSLFQDEMGENHGDAVISAHDAVSDMRLRLSKVALLRDSLPLFASAPFDAPAIAKRADSGLDSSFNVDQTRAAVHRFQFGGRSYIAVAVEPLDSVEADLAAIRRAVFFALPLILALAGAGGYWFAARNLAPLDSMAAQASRITGANLDSRLEIGDAAAELTTLAASFNELLARIDQSFEGMRRFVADASHELRTPVAVIRGEADVALSSDRTAAEYRESLAIILDESRRLSLLVDDLLNLARADAGRVKLRSQLFYWNDLLAECCRAMQSLAAARGIELAYRPPAVPPDLPFEGDEELLRRMTLNLLDNAIRYTPNGGRVSAELEARTDGVLLRISDTGIGIPPEAAPHVFERFFRADKSRSRENGGFGLGLAIVKWIAESHRGVVELASQPGAGSVFTVTLPR
jgi:two-component system, OmpR family, sensor kinase